MNKTLVFDLGGSSIKYCIDSLESFETHNVANISSDYVINFITDMANKENATHICISSPGLINVNTGEVKGMSAISGWCDINVFDKLKQKLNNKDTLMFIENDANCALLGCVSKYGKEISSAVSIVIGTGIGGAYYSDNKISHGHSNSICELGMIRDINNPSQSVSTMLSTNALCVQVNTVLNSKYNGLEVFNEYKNGNEEVIKIVDKWIEKLAVFVYNTIWTLDPEVTFIGGAISTNEIVVERIPLEVDKLFAENNLKRSSEIVFADKGNLLNLIGAKSLKN
ncbi:MAG: ROK family protein [Mycoplasma sp.]